MADKMPPLPGAGKSSGSTMPPLPGGGNVGGRNTAFSSDLITRQLRNAIGAGDVKTVKQLARGLNVSDRNVKALAAFTSKFTPKTGFASILPDLGTVVNPANLAKGIGQFAFGLGQEAVGFPTWKRALEGKKLSGLDIAGGIPLVGLAVGATRGFFDKSKRAEELAPGTNLIGQSYRRSYERVIHPTQSIKQYSERPVLTAIEDLGNLAMILGPVGKAVGAGATAASAGEAAAIAAGDTARAAQLASRAAMLSKVAGRLGQVENVANITVNAPFLPYSAAAKLANRGIAAGLEKFGAQALTESGALEAAYPRTRATLKTLRMLPENKMVNTILREAKDSTVPQMVAEQVTPYLEAAKILPDVNEQIAMHLTLENTVPGFATARQFLGEEQFAELIKKAYGSAAPMKAVVKAIDAFTGADPELAARIKQGIEMTAPSRAARGKMAMQYLNRAEQMGYKPQEAPVERALAPYRKKVEEARKFAEKQQALADAQRGRVQTVVDKLLERRRGKISEAQRIKANEDLQAALYKENETFQKALRKDIRGAKKMRDAAQKQYEGLRDQYRQAMRADPNWAGMPALRQEVLAAYQDYSRLVGEWSDLTTQARSWPKPLRSGVQIPKELTERQITSKMPAEGKATFLEGQARRAQRRFVNAQQRLAEQEAAIQRNPAFAPARLRPMLKVNQAVQEALNSMEAEYRAQGWGALADEIAAQADGVLTTLEQLEAAGVDAEQIIHSRVPQREPSRTVGPRLDENQFPRDVRRLDLQKTRTGRGEFDLTFQAQAQSIANRVEQVVRRQAAIEVADLSFMRRANDTIFKVKDATTGEMRNPMLREIPEGWEAWSPRTLFGNVEAKGPLADNVIIGPKDIIDSYKQYFKKAGTAEQVLRVTYDPAIQAFKTMVLPLWPAWNVVNVLGNAFLATFVAGETPLSLARGFAEVLRRRKEMGTWDVVDNPRLYQAGQTAELRDFINPYKKASKLRIAIDKAGSLGFKANQVVDDMFRSSVYLAKKAKGYSDEQALRLALDSMGDFTNLSQFERQVVRRIVPFYTWLRHMTKVAVKLPIEHPWRTAWMLSLAQDFSERDPWENILPTYMRGGIDIGGGTYLNAYNISPLTTPGEAVRAILEGRVPPVASPPITMGYARLSGLDPLTGIPYSRQPGTGRISETGVEIPTAPPLSQQLLNLSPQARLIQELTGRKDIARYASGQPVMVRNEQGKLVPLKTATQPNVKRIAAALLGTRTTTRKQMKDMVDAIIARNVALYKAANPEKQLSSGGTKNQMPPLP